MKFKSWKVFAVLFKIFLGISASTHWVVTENGRIQSQIDSAFHMRRPYDLLSLLEQEKRAENIERLYKEMLRRKADIDAEWAGLESATDLETRLYSTDKDCLQAGRPLTDSDLYISVADDGFGREGIILSELSPTDVPEGTPEIPDCKDAVELEFSMDTFPHLQVLSWNITGSAEYLEMITLNERNSRQIAAGLKHNKTSWFLYNLASLFWRTQGDLQRAVDCSKRAVHFSPRRYRDTPLLNLGCILQQARWPAEAAILLHAAIDHAPNKAISHYALGNVYAILGDYNRSIACYDNTLKLKPRWPAAEQNRFAVLCHHKLETSLYQLHRSLQGILAQLHDYHGLQEQWLKHQEELMYQQAPLEVKLQSFQHEPITALLSQRAGDKCLPQIQKDGSAILSCDSQLLAHHLQIDITLSLQLLLKNVESQAQKISEQMSRRMVGSPFNLNTNHHHSSKTEPVRQNVPVSKEAETHNTENNTQDDVDSGVEMFIDNIEDTKDLEQKAENNKSVDEILQEIDEKLKNNVVNVFTDILEENGLGWLRISDKKVLLMEETQQCHASNHNTGGCVVRKEQWSWDVIDNEIQLLTAHLSPTSEDDSWIHNTSPAVIVSLLVTWFQFVQADYKNEKANKESSVPPLCSSVGLPYSVEGLTPETVGDIKPEQRLKSLLSAIISGDEDRDISLAHISSRIAQALKASTSWTIAATAALFWRCVGNAENMVACLQLAVHDAPPESKDSPLHNIAQIMLSLDHHQEALLLASLALQVSPRSAFAHTALYHIYKLMGDKDKAVEFGRLSLDLQEKMRAT